MPMRREPAYLFVARTLGDLVLRIVIGIVAVGILIVELARVVVL